MEDVLAPRGLGFRMRLISQLMGRRFQELLTPYDLTPTHWVVLCCLWRQDDLPTTRIAEQLQQVGGTLTGVLDRMQERGLLERHRDGRDRRVWRVRLTAAGRDLEPRLTPLARQLLQETLRDFTPQEQEQLSQLLDRAIANFAAEPTPLSSTESTGVHP